MFSEQEKRLIREKFFKNRSESTLKNSVWLNKKVTKFFYHNR